MRNHVQTACVFNNSDVDELVFLDIKATELSKEINFDIVKEIFKECMMSLSICVGKLEQYLELFSKCKFEAVASASIFQYIQYTPNDIKQTLHSIGIPVRYNHQT